MFKYFGSSLFKLKNTTTKLKLETRRPSYMEWKEKFVNNDEIKDIGENERGNFHSEFSYENIKNINNALTWVRSELVSTYAIKTIKITLFYIAYIFDHLFSKSKSLIINN